MPNIRTLLQKAPVIDAFFISLRINPEIPCLLFLLGGKLILKLLHRTLQSVIGKKSRG